MGQTSRLRLIRDRFIAGHSNCDLRRYLDSVSPEIRDVVDRCRIWESHADPATQTVTMRLPGWLWSESVNRLAPTCNFDRGTSGSEDIRHGKTVTTAGEGGTESATRGCKPASTDNTGTDVALFSRWTAPTAKAASTTATHATRLDRRGLFLMWKVRSYSDALRICDDTSAGDNGPPAGGQRWLIREGGSASRVSIHARPRDPGGGTASTVPPRRTILDDVSLAAEQSGGGEPPLVSPGCSAVQTEKALAECPHDVVGLHAQKGTMWMSNDGVPLKNVESPYGGGVLPLLGAAGVCTPAMFPVAPALLGDEPPLGPWQVAVMRVDETPAGILPDKILLALHRTGIGRWIYMSYRTALHILLWKGALLAQKLQNHLHCWFLIMLTLLASMLLFRVCWSIYLHSRNRP